MSGSTASALSAESTRAEMIRAWGQVVVSVVGVLIFMIVAVLVLTTRGTPSEAGLVVLGIVGGGYTAVMGYWIGSSAGSSAKDAKMTAGPAAPPPGGTTTTVATAASATTSTSTTASPGPTPEHTTTTTTVEQPGTVTP